jgi:hypothetical protein
LFGRRLDRADGGVGAGLNASARAEHGSIFPRRRADDGYSPYVKRIDAQNIGLVSAVIADTPKAWCAALPDGGEAWLAKSVVENHGEDPGGRAILILPRWLAAKIGLSV